MTFIDKCSINANLQSLIDQENARHEEVLKAIETLRQNFQGATSMGGNLAPTKAEEVPTEQPVVSQILAAYGPKRGRPRKPVSGGESQVQKIINVIKHGWYSAQEIADGAGIPKSRVYMSMCQKGLKGMVEKRTVDGTVQYRYNGSPQAANGHKRFTTATA